VSKPDFAAQAGGGLDADRRRDWLKAQHAEANRRGARWHRFGFDKATNILRYEGWKARPAGEQHVSGPGGAP
jgi:hypothetical protein